jgi:hypothetical protein
MATCAQGARPSTTTRVVEDIRERCLGFDVAGDPFGMT